MAGKIKNILITLPIKDHHLKKLTDCLDPDANVIQCRPSEKEALAEALKIVDVAIVGGGVGRDLFTAPNLKWIHFDAAGLDNLAKTPLLDTNIAITGSAGRSAPALAEHVIYFMLSFSYRSRAIFASQSEKKWGYEGQEDTAALFAQTIGILGLGNTGVALAKRAKALEMTVLAHKRSNIEKPCYIDTLYTEENGDSIDEIVEKSDFIAVCTPLNNKTYHMLGEREFKMMKNTAVVANVGRGACIDEKALIEALRSGEIAGAGLDTFEKEPLPEDSPLWGLDNAIVTPHFTPPCPDKIGRSLDIVAENLIHYQKGEPMRNLLTRADIFELA
ncbi:MAG: D-2-hydroxyacid dehydrogenase [Oscillospiraceae bacterium]|nr:D-2-hydroxyacid dehydrogenase [Oscillospiraceae bacterium]